MPILNGFFFEITKEICVFDKHFNIQEQLLFENHIL